jgi:hypothetical protein
MKTLLALLTLTFGLSSHAAWNELECEGRIPGGKDVRIEVEQPFPYGSYFKRANLTLADEGSEKTYNFTVSTRVILSRVEYIAAGLKVDVSFWPDQKPRWGRIYQGTMMAGILENQYIQHLNCRFPNAQ